MQATLPRSSMQDTLSRSSVSETLNEKSTTSSQTDVSSKSSITDKISDEKAKLTENGHLQHPKPNAKNAKVVSKAAAKPLPYKWGLDLSREGHKRDHILREFEYQIVVPAGLPPFMVGEGNLQPLHHWIYIEPKPDNTGSIFASTGKKLVSFLKWPFQPSLKDILICRRTIEDNPDALNCRIPEIFILNRRQLEPKTQKDQKKLYKLEYWYNYTSPGSLGLLINDILTVIAQQKKLCDDLTECCATTAKELQALESYESVSHLTATTQEVYAEQLARVQLAKDQHNATWTLYCAANARATLAVAAYFVEVNSVLAWLEKSPSARTKKAYMREMEAFTAEWWKKLVSDEGKEEGDGGKYVCVQTVKAVLMDQEKFHKMHGDAKKYVTGAKKAAAAAVNAADGKMADSVMDEKATWVG